MKATAMFFGMFLTAITFVMGDFAYEIMMTENPRALGGWLFVGWFTFAPVAFFVLGYNYRILIEYDEYDDEVDEPLVQIGETYFRS